MVGKIMWWKTRAVGDSYKRTRTSPETEPCGKPEVLDIAAKTSSPTMTDIVCPMTYDVNHCKASPGTPKSDSSIFRRFLCEIKSKAAYCKITEFVFDFIKLMQIKE